MEELCDTSRKLTCHQCKGCGTIDLNIVSWVICKVLDPVWLKMSLPIGFTFDEVPIETKEFIECIECKQSFQWSEEDSYKFFKALESEHVKTRAF